MNAFKKTKRFVVLFVILSLFNITMQTTVNTDQAMAKTTFINESNDTDNESPVIEKEDASYVKAAETHHTPIMLSNCTTPVNPAAGHYYLDPDAIVVKTQFDGATSTNDHTQAGFFFSQDDTLYYAVRSTHTLTSMTLEGKQLTKVKEFNRQENIFTYTQEQKNGNCSWLAETYVPGDGINGNTKQARWTIFKVDIPDLAIKDEYDFFIKGIGGGHDVRGKIVLNIPSAAKAEAQKVWQEEPDVWADELGFPNVIKRPGSVTLQLLGYIGDQTYVLKESVVTAADGWFIEWDEVPLYNTAGKKYDAFSVREKTSPAGYLQESSNLVTHPDETIGTPLTVTNVYNKEHIKVTKKWVGPAARSATFELLANGVATGQKLELTATDNWVGYFSNLPRYDSSGGKITYTIQEVALAGYSSSRTAEAIHGESYTQEFEYTNTNNETATIHVEKVWSDPDIQGDEVTMQLLVGQEVKGTLVLNESNGWSGSFEQLPKFDPHTGLEMKYTIKEVKVVYGDEVLEGDAIYEGYDVTYDPDGPLTDGGKMTVYNAYKYGSLTVIKQDEFGGLLPGAVFKLTRDAAGNDVVAEGLTTGSEGDITVGKLERGTYYLHETKAPEGYRLLTSPIEIDISLENLTVVKEVVNGQIDWELPATGGIGTMVFYGGGVSLMAGAVYMLLRGRRQDS